MRQRAEAATPGAVLDRYDHGGGRLAVFDGPERQLVADFYGDGPDREHYTAWHPAVALAVADWLEAMVVARPPAPLLASSPALAVARAYLGTTTPATAGNPSD